jgi:hypothetical protein
VKGFFMRSLSLLAALFAIAVVVLGAPCVGRATVIAFTNFDEPASGAASYTPGAGAYELGFTAGQGAPKVGTDQYHISGTLDIGSNDAKQAYHLDRVSGSTLSSVTFATVDLTDYSNVNLSLWLYVPNTDYETSDNLTITLTFNDSATFTMLNIAGGTSDGTFAPYRGKWSEIKTQTGNVPDAKTSVSLYVISNTSLGDEELWIDDVFITPEPATLALMGFGMAGILWVSRRRSGKGSH